MKKLKYLFTIVSTMFMGMFGGQKKKGVRRFGIPGLGFILNIFSKNKKKAFPFLLLIPILCMGYGTDSFLLDIFKFDWLVRIVYGATLSLPFLFFGFKRWTLTMLTLAIAFSVRAGNLITFGTFDILIEDMVRYGALGFWIAYNSFEKK